MKRYYYNTTINEIIEALDPNSELYKVSANTKREAVEKQLKIAENRKAQLQRQIDDIDYTIEKIYRMSEKLSEEGE